MLTFDDSACHRAKQVCFNLLEERLLRSEKTLLNNIIIESVHEPDSWIQFTQRFFLIEVKCLLMRKLETHYF